MKLSDRQATLLARLAAAAERAGNNPWFLIVGAMGREPIALFTSNENVADVGEADLSELQAAGALRMIGLNSKGHPKYVVTNDGFEFSRAMRKGEADSVPVEKNKVDEAPRHSWSDRTALHPQRANRQELLRVFLCHSKGDKDFVRGVYDRLKGHGFEPWLDDEDLLPGQDWDLEIEKAVRQAHVVLAFLSNASVSKEGYVQKEINELQQPLPVHAADQRFTIRLSDREAWSDRRDVADLGVLHSLLHGRAKVYFVAPDGVNFAETPAFKVL